MIINKITINNFRQFKGNQSILFSTDPKKNVTVILGQNTSGKTTLIQAFNWCLYGRTSYKTKELINEDLVENMTYNQKAIVSVELEILHDKRLYNIKRSQIYKKEFLGEIKYEDTVLAVSYLEPDGQTQPVYYSNCKAVVEGILPEQLSDYFFFAGEQINEINTKGNVRDAVRGLMGLDVIANGMDHFNPKKSGSVINELNKSLVLSADKNIITYNSDLDIALKNLDESNKRKTDLEGQITILKDLIEKANKKILDNKEIRNKQEQRSNIERDICNLENKQKEEEKKLIEDFMSNHYKFFAKPLYVKALKVISEAKSEGEGVPHMHEQSIDYIIKRGRCICGTDLKGNQGAVESLKSEQALLPPKNIGTAIYSFRKLCDSYDNESNNYASRVESSYKQMRTTIRIIEEKKQELEIISKEIANKDFNFSAVEDNRQQLIISRDDCEKKLQDAATRIGKYGNEVTNIQSKISGLAADTEKNARIRKCLTYADAIFEWFKKDYDKNIQKVKEDLSRSISQLFSDMFHGKRIVEVDDNYRITLKIDDGKGGVELDPSMGEAAVKNFAFIAGLVALARERAQNKNQESGEKELLNTEPYPLVMDAPFSNTDHVHIRNISKTVPKISEQVIFIIMEKDWDIAKEVMYDKVGKIMKIVKTSEKISELKGGIN